MKRVVSPKFMLSAFRRHVLLRKWYVICGVLFAGVLCMGVASSLWRRSHLWRYSHLTPCDHVSSNGSWGNASDFATTAHVVVSGQNISYIYPSRMRGWNTPVVLGVLSHSQNRRSRDMIRQTWGRGQRVLFVISEPCSPSPESPEMRRHQDLLILRRPETYRGLPYKTQVFFHAVYAHTDAFGHALKTDDDSYVNVPRLAQVLSADGVDYWGYIFAHSEVQRQSSHKFYVAHHEYAGSHFPPFCSGVGYAVSRRFLACFKQHISAMVFMPMEDAATGIIAERCDVAPIDGSPGVQPYAEGRLQDLIVRNLAYNSAKVKQNLRASNAEMQRLWRYFQNASRTPEALHPGTSGP